MNMTLYSSPAVMKPKQSDVIPLFLWKCRIYIDPTRVVSHTKSSESSLY